MQTHAEFMGHKATTLGTSVVSLAYSNNLLKTESILERIRSSNTVGLPINLGALALPQAVKSPAKPH